MHLGHSLTKVIHNPECSRTRNSPAMALLKTFSWLILCVFLLVGLLPFFTRIIVFDMPGHSVTFDCDDATLFMYERLSKLGIASTPIVGDLHATGEKYTEINHIWLLADIAGFSIPIDWGIARFDSQHHEGHTVSYQQLLLFVQQDQVSGSIPAK